MDSSSLLKVSALQLRKSGKSFREISKELELSVSTVHLWTRSVVLTDRQRNQIDQKQKEAFHYGRKIAFQFKRQKKDAREKDIMGLAQKRYKLLKDDPIFILGLSLYWAEGFKKDHSLGFVNSDPVMLQSFLSWLEKYGTIRRSDIRLRIQINQILKDEYPKTLVYWTNFLGIPVSQFQKPFFQISKRIYSVKDENYRGQVRIRVIGTRSLFLTINQWIECLKQDVVKN